ncbi:MmgE/PrpD family protein [Phytohabitans sp. ZYX-F-186]|uniref:MmgE/PrpD family protein n=1 Tax=Phytohabitans maris TaxID=3071409 RepID=A0ABU0ZC53_9ACTN|nr:MmgE/PrpD family protein [Phytohabitans sp. ZYX-F-186]MDQ7904650.1 MmgE/PrpD family protein [Phytohabitans sp. ZYX-F-186]
MHITRALAEFATDDHASLHGPELHAAVTAAVIDTVACCVAGGSSPGSRMLHATYEPLPDGQSTVVSTGATTSPTVAALLNAYDGHVHDLDDIADAINGHPSVVLVPALVAVAEAFARSGRELVDAYVVGFEVASAIARLLPARANFEQGWHTTSVVGVVAAAAGCSRLLGSSVDETQSALGIAASTASGSRRNFGTHTKALHAGVASKNAVLSALLARRGFTSAPDQIEADAGFLALYGERPRPRPPAELFPDGWTVVSDRGTQMKRWPCCGATHRPAASALALAPSVRHRLDRVQRVRVVQQPGGFLQLIHHRPTTGLQGKFSAEYVVAAALLDGALSMASFADSAVTRPEIVDLLPLVELAEQPGTAASPEFAMVEVEVDGEVVRHRTDAFPFLPATDVNALDAKFHDCARGTAVPWDTTEALRYLKTIGAAPAVDLRPLFASRPRAEAAEAFSAA